MEFVYYLCSVAPPSKWPDVDEVLSLLAERVPGPFFIWGGKDALDVIRKGRTSAFTYKGARLMQFANVTAKHAVIVTNDPKWSQ